MNFEVYIEVYHDYKNVHYKTEKHWTTTGVTSLNGARPLNSNGAPTKYKIFTVSKKKSRHFYFGFSYRLVAPPGAFVLIIFPTTER